MNRSLLVRLVAFISVAAIVITVSRKPRADSAVCSGVNVTLPFTDVAGNFFFCQIAAAYFSGLANGTTPTTYGPDSVVTRDQMAAFVTRTMDQSVKRASSRAALNQFWTTQSGSTLALTTVGSFPESVRSDGADLWVANYLSNSVSRVRASDGRLLDTWTGAVQPDDVLAAMGKVYITGDVSPGVLYEIDPTQPAGAVTTVSSPLGAKPGGLAFDGLHIWTANFGTSPGNGSVSIVTVNPPGVTTVSAGFNRPGAILYDGANIWIVDDGDNTLKKLDSNGNIILSFTIGFGPSKPAFDGTNIWVPIGEFNSVVVVRAAGALTGQVLATLTGNGLLAPASAAFDGERILVTNRSGQSVSLWRASDLTPIGSFPTGGGDPTGVCSDGINFWITFTGTGKLGRF